MFPLFPAVESFVTFFFVLLRLGAFFTTAPPFGGQQVPWQVRTAFSLAVAVAVTPMVSPAPVSGELVHLMLASAREVVIGLAMGFVVSLLFMAVQFAGELLDVNAGFSFSSVLNPAFGTHGGVLGQFQLMLATVVFLVMDGHHQAIRGALDSFQAVPPGTLTLGVPASPVVELVARFFVAGLRLVAPALVAVLMADVALSMLARTAPSMNLFTIGFPIKMAVGLIVVAATLPLFVSTLQRLFGDLAWDLRVVAQSLR